MNAKPEIPVITTDNTPSVTKSLLSAEDLPTDFFEKKPPRKKLITLLILFFIIFMGVIGYYVWQNCQTKLRQKITDSQVDSQSELQSSTYPQPPIEGILKEIDQLDDFFKYEKSWLNYVHWKKVDQDMRFAKGARSKFLGKKFDSLEESEKLYNKITAFLIENSFEVDPTRVGHFSYDGGAEFISSEIWTNDSELLLINVYKDFGDFPNWFSIEIYYLENLELVEKIEKEQTEILNEYFKLRYSNNSENEWKLAYVDMDEENNIITTKLFSDLNQDRYLTIINYQAGDVNFLYYSKDAKTGAVKGLFTSGFEYLASFHPIDNATAFAHLYQCDDFKKLNITQNELDKMRVILEKEHASWGLQKCQLDN